MRRRVSTYSPAMAQQMVIRIAAEMGITLSHAEARDLLEQEVPSWPFGSYTDTELQARQYLALNVFMDPGCEPCREHWETDRDYVEDAMVAFEHLTDASSPKAYRFYFSVFHTNGHVTDRQRRAS